MSRGASGTPSRRPPALLSSPAPGFFIAALERRGLPIAPLLARWKIERGALAFPVHEISRFTEDCAALARDPLFGLHVALELPRGAWGAAEFVWRSAPTFGDAIAALQELAPTISELLQPHVEQLGDRLRLGYPLSLGTPPIGRHGNEFILGVASRMLRELSGARQRPLRIGLAHPRPAEARAVSEGLGAPLVFGQPQNWIELSPAIASTPIVSADPALFKALRELLEPLKAARSKPRSFVSQVAQAIEARLVGGSLTATGLARALKVSPRSLQRRLQQDGTHLSALIDQVRGRRAGTLLADPAIALDDVAYQLGFSQLSAFVRAYRRWTGNSPGAAREALLGGDAG